MFKRVHPGKDYAKDFIERVGKARNLARRVLLTVEHAVGPPVASSGN
jgi:hypothetical protein